VTLTGQTGEFVSDRGRCSTSPSPHMSPPRTPDHKVYHYYHQHWHRQRDRERGEKEEEWWEGRESSGWRRWVSQVAYSLVGGLVTHRDGEERALTLRFICAADYLKTSRALIKDGLGGQTAGTLCLSWWLGVSATVRGVDYGTLGGTKEGEYTLHALNGVQSMRFQPHPSPPMEQKQASRWLF